MSANVHVPTPPKRVKVYEQIKDEWTDKGTGYCSGEITPDSNEPYIIVRSEENRHEILLKEHIRGEIQFQKQQDSLIVWSNGSNTELALSFQEADGCMKILDFLVFVQKTLAQHISITIITNTDDGEISELIAGPVFFPPDPCVGNLADVHTAIVHLVSFQFSREPLCAFLTGTDYLKKLALVFDQAEAARNLDELHKLCYIIKLLFGLNDCKIVERLIEDGVVIGTIGALEYDPAFPIYKANHRQYFDPKEIFREVIPINDPDVRIKIKQTYRLHFLKDVLARLFEESTISMITSMIYFNQMSVVIALQNSDYFQRLFEIYQGPSSKSKVEQRREGVRFIHSMFFVTKGFQPHQKKLTFSILVEKGMFPQIEFAVADSDRSIRMLGTELLTAMIELDPILLRSYAKSQTENNTNPDNQFTLMDTLVDQFINDSDIGLKFQTLECLKCMLDNPLCNPAILGSYDDNFLTRRIPENTTNLLITKFYERCGKKIFSVLKARAIDQNATTKTTTTATNGLAPPAQRTLYEHVCDLVSFCIRMHGDKCWVCSVEEGAWPGIAALIRGHGSHTVQIAALRTLRQTLAVKYQAYGPELIRSGCIDAIIDVLLKMGNRNNLVNSVCLELLNTIKNLDIYLNAPQISFDPNSVGAYLVKTRRNDLREKLAFAGTAQQLVETVDVLEEAAIAAANGSVPEEVAEAAAAATEIAAREATVAAAIVAAAAMEEAAAVKAMENAASAAAAAASAAAAAITTTAPTIVIASPSPTSPTSPTPPVSVSSSDYCSENNIFTTAEAIASAAATAVASGTGEQPPRFQPGQNLGTQHPEYFAIAATGEFKPSLVPYGDDDEDEDEDEEDDEDEENEEETEEQEEQTPRVIHNSEQFGSRSKVQKSPLKRKECDTPPEPRKTIQEDEPSIECSL
ncbi:uncharacterized protein SAPINGB_P002247 [Magnusiomyces paraingens]|uniref:Uncharacterized protein n=1 Tax=Magnusiomyces paraingens TaxID=2606893 RepID=A0A5E8BIJ9_9ASCO|nr:uncharacterized protein SAPINGB_P002247 [Saprochaete ingens]VVT49390.1 unnamed protein product [Saprochaete ingens]